MRGIEPFQSCARAVLPEPLALVFAQAEKARCIPEHDVLDLSVVVSDGSQEEDHDVGKRFGRERLWKTFFLTDHRPVGAVHQPLVAMGEMFLERPHAFKNLLAGTNLEDLAERADVGISVGIVRAGDDLPDRPFPAFVDVACRPSELNGVVEMTKMSHVDAQPGGTRVILGRGPRMSGLCDPRSPSSARS